MCGVLGTRFHDRQCLVQGQRGGERPVAGCCSQKSAPFWVRFHGRQCLLQGQSSRERRAAARDSEKKALGTRFHGRRCLVQGQGGGERREPQLCAVLGTGFTAGNAFLRGKAVVSAGSQKRFWVLGFAVGCCAW